VAVALTVKNNVYFVIFTILEFVGLLIFLNDIVGIALMSTRVNRTGQSLPEQERNSWVAVCFAESTYALKIGCKT